MRKHSVIACFIALYLFPGIPSSGVAASVTQTITPEETVRQAFDALTHNHPQKLFDLLPESYQQDIERMVVAFAEQANAGTWKQFRAILGRLSRVLTKQEHLLMEVFAEQAAADKTPETMQNGIKALAAAFDHLAESKLLDLDRLQQGKIRELLATDGSALFGALQNVVKASSDKEDADVWAAVRDARIELLDMDQDTATVRTVIDEESEEIKLTLVENRWIPTEMADGWQKSINEINEYIALMDPASPEGQQRNIQASMVLSMIDGFLTQIESAETREDLDRLLENLFMLPMLPMGNKTMQR